ncbi:MAG TPA: hypothetical protein VLF16_15685 [Pseudomonas sp.]|nr:hypothetical protein [Pseudomonas sp.]
MNNPTDIYAQEQAQEAAAERQRLLMLGEKADLMWLMGDARGRRIVARLLDSTGVLSSSFTPDPYWTAHNEGRRKVGIQLLEQLQLHTPGEYLQMMSERILPKEEQ